MTIVEVAEQLLPREDRAIAELIADALREDGIELRLGTGASEAASDNGRRLLRLDDGSEVTAERLLIAIGREPRLGDIGLDSLDVETGPAGVSVDERCRAGEGSGRSAT